MKIQIILFFFLYCWFQSISAGYVVVRDDSSNNSSSDNSTDNTFNPCSQAGNSCIVGTFQWDVPTIYGNPNPFPSSQNLTLKWHYSPEVQLFPDQITIQIKLQTGLYTDIVKGLSGTDGNGNPTTSYVWMPTGFSTWFGYRLVIFETASGRTAAARGGGANPIVSAEFGILTMTTGGVLYSPNLASMNSPSKLGWVIWMAFFSVMTFLMV